MPIELTKVAYVTAATAVGGRSGHVTSADGLVDFDLRQPGSTAEPAVNPETLFAAGYAACFQGALENRAKTKGVDTSGSTVTANVSFGPSEDDGFGIAVEIHVELPGIEIEQAQELVEMAHRFCPYSKATLGNIPVTLKIVEKGNLGA